MQIEVTKLKEKYHSQESFVIGTVGRIAKEKSLDKELKAFKNLLKKDNSFKLVIIGDGPELDNLKKLTKELNITEHVIFTGKIKYDLIPTWYHLFDVMSSFSVTETQGLTIIEGLASSLPIVCINDESFKTMVTHNYNGYLFNNDDEFISYILKLKNNPENYQEIALNAKNSIYKYSKEVFASNCLEVYHKAIEKKKAQN